MAINLRIDSQLGLAREQLTLLEGRVPRPGILVENYLRVLAANQ